MKLGDFRNKVKEKAEQGIFEIDIIKEEMLYTDPYM